MISTIYNCLLVPNMYQKSFKQWRVKQKKVNTNYFQKIGTAIKGHFLAFILGVYSGIQM